MKKYTLLLFACFLMIFMSCKGPAGPKGDSGPLCIPSLNTEFNEVLIGASRTYAPVNSLNNKIFYLEGGLYGLPPSLTVVTGNAGTGWASIIMGRTRFCYQGTAINNDTLSDSFEYMGAVLVDKRCSQKASSFFGRTFFTDDIVIEVQLHGLGCGSLCTDTEIEGIVKRILWINNE